MPTNDEAYPKHLTNIPYSDDCDLNTVDIYLPRPPSSNDSDSIWLIYIHGGAWRDPCITSNSFTPTLSSILKSAGASSVAATAALNYRLSPYPSHPTHPSNPADPARNAKHPDHITDVLSAILYLQSSYNFGSNYILIGHSVGATLALQVAMKRYWGAQYESTFALELNVAPPLAVVGLEGIYDMPALVERHGGEPVYRDFVTNAIDAADWREASPTSGDYEESWPDGRVVILAHSANDELVEMEQPEMMRAVLEAQGFVSGGGRGGGGRGEERRVVMVELKGGHDEVWQTGEASEAVAVAIRELAPS